MKSLVGVLSLVGLAVGQFGGFGGGGRGGGQCDYAALLRGAQAKEQCLEEGRQMMRDAMRELQRIDSSCNQGAVELCEKCAPLAQSMKQSNDMDVRGILECCIPDRYNGGGGRRCEWKEKRPPHGHHGGGGGGGGHGRGHHHKGHGGRGPHGGGSPPPPPPPGMDGPPPMEGMMEEVMATKKTLAGMVMKSMGMYGHMMNEKLMWCENEDRPVSRQAMEQVVRPWKDRLTAKIFSCYAPIMDIVTNCTDVAPSALECMENGFGWGCQAEETCHAACGEDSLQVFCNAFTQAARSSQRSAQGNNANNNNNNNNNNNGGFFDPFQFNNA